ncbi:hypothetical protein CEUSTIGMA_g12858.t1 [Chlamydomonas eustigma]|uniref:Uncharacterized protein n=1 Tax=Chlamydomonas eustigma TaxID=1157962 RepID=A0A250XR74_9CHLO|nr:hypothetical protein CEUSTIGMA_g12858.t1 [Chlamydomonas eustigma]|eukprot:GAX85442.1 hypothetical protein CEUSTIGMA_g12858.t1 [Chlamydomonas eustigma]
MEKPLNIPPFIKPKPPEIPHKLGAVRRPAGALNQQRQSPDLGRLAPLQPSLSQNSAIIEASKHQAPLASQAGLPCLNQAISSATPATPAAVNWGSFFQSPQHTPSPERFADLRGIIDGISPKFGVRKPVGYIPITPSSFASTPIYKFSPPSCFLAPQQQQGLKGSSYTPSRSTAFSNYSPSRGDLTPQHQSSTCLLPHTPNEVSFIGNPQMSHKLSRFHVPLSSQVAGKASLNISLRQESASSDKASLNIPLRPMRQESASSGKASLNIPLRPMRQESASSGKASLNIPLRQESASSSPALTGNRHDSPDDSTPLIPAVLKPSSLSVSPPSLYAGPIKAPGIYKPGLCHQATAPIHDLSSNTPTTLIPAVRAPLLNWQVCQPRLPRQSGLLSASSVLLPPASVGLPALRPAPPRPGRQVLEPLPTAPKTVIVQQLQQPDLPVDLPVKPFNQLHPRQQQRLQQQVHGFRPTEGVPHPVLQRASSAQKVLPASRWNSHLPSQGSALKVRARASLVKGRTDLGSKEQKMIPTKALAAGEVGDAAMVPLSSAAMKLSLRAAHQRLEQGQAGDGVVDEAEHLLYSGRTSDIVEGHTVSKGEGVQTSALATITCSFLTCEEFCETYSDVSSPVRMAGSASPAENSPAGVAAHVESPVGVAAHVESPVGVAAHVESLGHLSVLRGSSKRTEHQSQSHLASADTDEQPKIYRRTESGNNRNNCSSIAGSKNDFMRSTARRSLGSTFEKNCGKF